MRLTLALLAGITLFGGAEHGEMYGTVRLGKQLLPGVPVTVACGAVAGSDTTDKYGAYRLFVKATGNCTLTVRYQDQAPTLAVTSSGTEVRYRLVLELTGAKYTLRSE